MLKCSKCFKPHFKSVLWFQVIWTLSTKIFPSWCCFTRKIKPVTIFTVDTGTVQLWEKIYSDCINPTLERFTCYSSSALVDRLEMSFLKSENRIYGVVVKGNGSCHYRGQSHPGISAKLRNEDHVKFTLCVWKIWQSYSYNKRSSPILIFTFIVI